MSATHVRVGDRLYHCPEEQLGVVVPMPLNRSLLDLCDGLEKCGAGRVEKKLLVAAILRKAVIEARDGGLNELLRALDEYRRGSVRDALPEPPDDDDATVAYPPLQRGRRAAQQRRKPTSGRGARDTRRR